MFSLDRVWRRYQTRHSHWDHLDGALQDQLECLLEEGLSGNLRQHRGMRIRLRAIIFSLKQLAQRNGDDFGFADKCAQCTRQAIPSQRA